MKHLLLLASLAFSVLLLSGCPERQLPTPRPKAPEPKANVAQFFSPTWQLGLNGDRPAPLNAKNT